MSREHIYNWRCPRLGVCLRDRHSCWDVCFILFHCSLIPRTRYIIMERLLGWFLRVDASFRRVDDCILAFARRILWNSTDGTFTFPTDRLLSTKYIAFINIIMTRRTHTGALITVCHCADKPFAVNTRLLIIVVRSFGLCVFWNYLRFNEKYATQWTSSHCLMHLGVPKGVALFSLHSFLNEEKIHFAVETKAKLVVEHPFQSRW